ncbi:MAG: UDP-N-acetylmuramoyl-tripeptide--D-alanyl-D-alanine ligase [Thermaerobacter sp.]|nr:UDP-N-acetylmuramoyl-tripeptide--D-alanyl-D-alanine ligase [Thermaerobacter sp.]
MRLSVAEAAVRVGGQVGARAAAAHFSRVVVDSRQAGPDSLFVALPGTRTHGAHFAGAAQALGAVVLMAAPLPADVDTKRVWRHDDPLAALGGVGRWALECTGARVVGITGSVGKSSTRALVQAVLGGSFRVGATPGNLNTAIGLPMALVAQPTPLDWFVAEMGMRAAGEITRLTAIAPPSVAVLTNIGYAHVGQLGSVEAVAEAKAEILAGLTAGDVAVLNGADPRVARLARRVAGRVVWFGTPDADVEVRAVRAERGGVAFELRMGAETARVRLPWDGVHQADNAAAAAAVAGALGLPLAEVAARLGQASAADSHFRRVVVGGITILDDTYNASPASVRAGLAVLAQERGRRVAVVGDMLELGSTEEALHRELGTAAAACADLVWTVGDRARWVAEAACAAGVPTSVFSGLDELAAALDRELQAGDVVYLKAGRAVGLDRVARQLMEDHR